MAVKNGVLYQHTDEKQLIGANPSDGVRFVSPNGYAPGGSSLNAGNPQVGDAYLKVLDQQASAPAAAAGTQSSFADSGSMKAVSAPTVNANPTANPNGATPTYSDYMGTQYTTSRPGDFQYGDAPTFADPYDPAGKSQAYNDLLQNQFTYEKYPEYTDRLQGTWDAQLAAAQAAANRQFTYDASTDPVYQAYLKQYAREGQRASANTLGQAAAMTGGRPSSYAVSAASQAGNYYAAQAADKLPELYQQAYQRYLQDYQNKLGLLSAINQRANTEQGIWAGNANNYWRGVDTDLSIYNDRIQNAMSAAELERALSNDAFNRYQTALGQYNTDKNFAYGQNTDDINWEADAENTTYSRSEAEKKYADERADYEFNKALQLAQLGDYSALEALGYDTSYIRAMNEAALADQQAQTAARLMKGSGSSGSSGSSRSSGSGSSGDGSPDLGNGAPQPDDAAIARITQIGDAAAGNNGIVESDDDWNFLLQYFTEEELNDEFGLYSKADEEDVAAAANALQDADFINQQYEAQIDPKTSIALGKARQNDGMVTDPKDWKTLTDKYTSDSLNDAGYYYAGSSTAGLKGGNEAMLAVTGNDYTVTRGNQTISSGASDGSGAYARKTGSKAAPGVKTAAPSSSSNKTAGTSNSSASAAQSAEKKTESESEMPDFTKGRKFAGAADAMKFASYFGVPASRQKYYNEREFNVYKTNNADPSLKEYRTYQDYLNGYTNYLIYEYGAKV